MADHRKLDPIAQKVAPESVRAPQGHARVGGHPDSAPRAGALDSRLRGNDSSSNDLIFHKEIRFGDEHGSFGFGRRRTLTIR